MQHSLFTPKIEQESKVSIPSSERLSSYFRALLMQHTRLDKQLKCYLCYYEDPSDSQLLSFIQRLKQDLNTVHIHVHQFKMIVGLGAYEQTKDVRRLIQNADYVFYIGSRAGQAALRPLPSHHTSLPYFDSTSLAKNSKAEQFRVETLLLDAQAAEKFNVISFLWNGSKKTALSPSAVTLNNLHFMAYQEQTNAYEDLESDHLNLKSYEENLIDLLTRLDRCNSSVLNAKLKTLKQMIQNSQSDQEINTALDLDVSKNSPTFQI